MSALAAATGLGRATLYHHFPGGKADMADAAMADVEQKMTDVLLQPLSQPGTPSQRLARMICILDDYYRGGTIGCLLAVLAANRTEHGLRPRVARAFDKWIAALATLARQAGSDDPDGRAEEAVVAIQGSLVLASAYDSEAPFRRVLALLPRILLPTGDSVAAAANETSRSSEVSEGGHRGSGEQISHRA